MISPMLIYNLQFSALDSLMPLNNQFEYWGHAEPSQLVGEVHPQPEEVEDVLEEELEELDEEELKEELEEELEEEELDSEKVLLLEELSEEEVEEELHPST